MRVHSWKNPLECGEVSSKHASKGLLKTHQRVYLGGMLFECDDWNKNSRTSSNLKAHRRTAVHAPFNYEDYQQKFKSDSEFTMHQQADCKPKFARNDGTLRHKHIVHGVGADGGGSKGGNGVKT